MATKFVLVLDIALVPPLEQSVSPIDNYLSPPHTIDSPFVSNALQDLDKSLSELRSDSETLPTLCLLLSADSDDKSSLFLHRPWRTHLASSDLVPSDPSEHETDVYLTLQNELNKVPASCALDIVWLLPKHRYEQESRLSKRLSQILVLAMDGLGANAYAFLEDDPREKGDPLPPSLQALAALGVVFRSNLSFSSFLSSHSPRNYPLLLQPVDPSLTDSPLVRLDRHLLLSAAVPLPSAIGFQFVALIPPSTIPLHFLDLELTHVTLASSKSTKRAAMVLDTLSNRDLIIRSVLRPSTPPPLPSWNANTSAWELLSNDAATSLGDMFVLSRSGSSLFLRRIVLSSPSFTDLSSLNATTTCIPSFQHIPSDSPSLVTLVPWQPQLASHFMWMLQHAALHSDVGSSALIELEGSNHLQFAQRLGEWYGSATVESRSQFDEQVSAAAQVLHQALLSSPQDSNVIRISSQSSSSLRDSNQLRDDSDAMEVDAPLSRPTSASNSTQERLNESAMSDVMFVDMDRDPIPPKLVLQDRNPANSVAPLDDSGSDYAASLDLLWQRELDYIATLNAPKPNSDSLTSSRQSDDPLLGRSDFGGENSPLSSSSASINRLSTSKQLRQQLTSFAKPEGVVEDRAVRPKSTTTLPNAEAPSGNAPLPAMGVSPAINNGKRTKVSIPAKKSKPNSAVMQNGAPDRGRSPSPTLLPPLLTSSRSGSIPPVASPPSPLPYSSHLPSTAANASLTLPPAFPPPANAPWPSRVVAPRPSKKLPPLIPPPPRPSSPSMASTHLTATSSGQPMTKRPSRDFLLVASDTPSAVASGVPSLGANIPTAAIPSNNMHSPHSGSAEDNNTRRLEAFCRAEIATVLPTSDHRFEDLVRRLFSISKLLITIKYDWTTLIVDSEMKEQTASQANLLLKSL